MDAEVKAKWLKALRSGEYAQCKSRLYFDGNYCCIGVLAAVQGVDFKTDERFEEEDDICTGTLPIELMAGLGPLDSNELADMNDGGGLRKAKTFSEIADYIEEKL